MADGNNPDFLSVNTLKGDKVVNRAGEDIGKIEELMIDLQDGRVGYAVLSFGGFLGMSDKFFAIPWQALQLRVHEHAFLLDIPKETLENAEGFDKGNWPLTTREGLSGTYTYYGCQPYWQSGVAGQTGRVSGKVEPERESRMESTAASEGPEFLSASTIKGDKIISSTGEDIGKIDELMIDLENGRVAYAAVSHGGYLGVGSKLFAIPWQALQLKVHEHAFVLDISKETLDKEEGFDKDNWPLTRERLSRTYTNYGYEPYWQIVAAEQPEVSTGKIKQAGVSAGVIRKTETKRTEVVETDEEIRVRQERERLEGLRGTQEEKLSQLEKQQMEKEKQAKAERERLAQLERERIEAERQAEAERERLAQLESELQEARRQEETERVTRLENELKEVQTQEEIRRDRLVQLERECTEARKQAEVEREELAQLESERTEVERRADVERERLAQLERERTEVERRVEAAGKKIPDFLSANTIKTDRVVNTAGEDLGRIDELMIDLDNGRVAYAVLSFGGFMGMSDKLFAIPWNFLTYREHEHAFTLDIPRDVLESAEGFDKNTWPLTREELSDTYTYYGYQPYWQRELAERAGTPGGTESEMMTRAERKRREQLKTAEEIMAQQDKERIEKQEATETDKEKKERLERERVVAERREHKYQ
ncbi:antigen [Methanosarcina siciliae HI350]|uniref:Antigen n=1 Tax=Methanosarcina siciliae HI350 TaxID=1434119 RepID=A0A0E3PAX5_9EURY|nr:PRC-barrel domain-containing protein [Methanosarcina siciliae]AKB31204.1 antigen [Methanosarcina siciliae HI350]